MAQVQGAVDGFGGTSNPGETERMGAFCAAQAQCGCQASEHFGALVAPWFNTHLDGLREAYSAKSDALIAGGALRLENVSTWVRPLTACFCGPGSQRSMTPRHGWNAVWAWPPELTEAAARMKSASNLPD